MDWDGSSLEFDAVVVWRIIDGKIAALARLNALELVRLPFEDFGKQ